MKTASVETPRPRLAPRTRGGLALTVNVAATGVVAARLGRILRRDGLSVTIQAGAEELDGKPDALVIVLEGLDQEGLLSVQRARRTAPDCRLVIVADAVAWRTAREVLAAGADAIVLQRDADKCLPSVLRSVCAGQFSLPAGLRDTVAKPSLSTREKQILGMVVMGFTNGEIAAKLFLAETTVKSHLSSAFAKLGVRSRTQATALILDPERGFGTGILAISENESLAGPPDHAPSS